MHPKFKTSLYIRCSVANCNPLNFKTNSESAEACPKFGWQEKNLGWGFNSERGCTHAVHSLCNAVKPPNLKLKTRWIQLSSYLPSDIALSSSSQSLPMTQRTWTGSEISEQRQHQSFLGRVLNFEQDCLIIKHIKSTAWVQPSLELKTLTRFYPISLWHEFWRHVLSYIGHFWTKVPQQGILISLYCWPPVWLVLTSLFCK